jgi:Fe-S cluster assembly protein SufB
VYIPPGVKCPIELGSYFRINAKEAGQFERTLIVADEGSSVSYLEGCSAPQRDEKQMHAAVVEIIAMKGADVKYSTVQNWYPGDKQGRGGIYNFVTKRALVEHDAKVSWVQLEVGSALTWKYPSCILKGDRAVGEFFSVAITNNMQKADTGTKMIHIGTNTSSTIISKGVSAGRSEGVYRGLVKIGSGAEDARNYTKCDHLIIGGEAAGHTFPEIVNLQADGKAEHEASVSKVSEEQLFYLQSRGVDSEKSISLVVNGFASDIIERLPAEFAMEAKELINISLE